MDKKFNDLIIRVEDSNERKLYRGIVINSILFHCDKIEFNIGTHPLVDEKLIIHKVKGLKIIIE